MVKSTLTDKSNKAKCMAFRNGKRCNKKATTVVTYNGAGHIGHQARCSGCAQNGDVRSVEQSSTGGFFVQVDPFAQMGGRCYTEVE